VSTSRRRITGNLEGCRVGGGALAREPPSAAQTARAVFPHAAFTKTLSPSSDQAKNQKNLDKAVAKLLKNYPLPQKK
jgi:hypothetical protein